MVKRKGSPFPQQTREVVSLLTGLGIPVLSLRVGEAEAACAYLCRIGIAQGCITSDADGNSSRVIVTTFAGCCLSFTLRINRFELTLSFYYLFLFILCCLVALSFLCRVSILVRCSVCVEVSHRVQNIPNVSRGVHHGQYYPTIGFRTE